MIQEKYSLVLLSGGHGSRMENSIPKQYLLLLGKPVIVHIMECVDKIEEIDEVIICASTNYHNTIDEYINNFKLSKEKFKIVVSGETRQKTVYNGVVNSRNEKILIHEAARPFVEQATFQDLIKFSGDTATYGAPIPYTVLIADDIVKDVLDREKLINVQLPQKFIKEELLIAFDQAFLEKKVFTEESSMLKFYFKEKNIGVLKGNQYNLKITYPLDLKFGEVILNHLLNREDF